MRADKLNLEIPVAGETGAVQNVEAFSNPEANFIQIVIDEYDSGSISVEYSFDGENWHVFYDMDAIKESSVLKTMEGLKEIAPIYVRVKATSDFVAASAAVHYCGTNMQVN